MMVRVKICGITNVSDALTAVDAGADAVGLNFWPGSVRYLKPEQALPIRLSLPPFVSAVGVFVNTPPKLVREIVEFCKLDYAQLHGRESPRKVRELRDLRIIKAIHVREEGDLAELERYDADGYLLDTLAEEAPGGTGQTFDWELARRAASRAKVVLAGGLTPENVAEAIQIGRPYAVDVASGVESEPGVKSRDLVRAFVRAAKSVVL